MGQTVSKLRGHLITRPLQRFNIDSRTEKLLNREKPIPAPKFRSDVEALEKLRAQHPEVLEEVQKRDAVLEERLKRVRPQHQ